MEHMSSQILSTCLARYPDISPIIVLCSVGHPYIEAVIGLFEQFLFQLHAMLYFTSANRIKDCTVCMSQYS